MGRKILIGCGALSVLGVAFIVLIVIVGLISGGGSDTAGSGGGGSEEAAENRPGATKDNPVPVGEPVQAGKAEWLVTGARKATELQSSFGDAKQGNFVIVDFTFTNGYDEATTLDSESFRLIDSEGREFEVDTDTFEYVDPNKDIFLDQVNPGVAKDGEIIFSVAPEASGFVLQAGDTQMFEDANAYIDLEF